MNFETRVESVKNDLTAAEEKAADYILKHPEEADRKSVV